MAVKLPPSSPSETCPPLLPQPEYCAHRLHGMHEKDPMFETDRPRVESAGLCEIKDRLPAVLTKEPGWAVDNLAELVLNGAVNVYETHSRT